MSDGNCYGYKKLLGQEVAGRRCEMRSAAALPFGLSFPIHAMLVCCNVRLFADRNCICHSEELIGALAVPHAERGGTPLCGTEYCCS